MSFLHQSMYIFKAGLSSSYYGWAKYKEKVTDVSDSNQTGRERGGGVWGHGISSIEERACENSRGQLKKKLNSLEFSRDATQFCIISSGDSLFSLEFLRLKSQI